MNRILIVGAEGQLGTALSKTAPETIVAAYLDLPYLDITQESSVQRVVDEFRPYQILNVAGYTDVDRAEQEPEATFAINGQGAAYLASAAKRVGARLLHLSTDYVFDGASETPYQPDEQPNPLNVYGKSKLAGEAELARILPEEYLVVRTAWLYSPWGENFVKTMLRLMCEKEELRVVVDQVGSPTSAQALAEVLWRLVARSDLTGIYHWTDAGETSWYDFACAIQRESLQLGLLERPCQITPITTEQLSRPAPRPHYSVLDSSKLSEILDLQPEPWPVSLRKVLMELQQ